MEKAIMLFVLAVIFALSALGFKRLYTSAVTDRATWPQTYGVIEKWIQDGGSQNMCYVRFEIDGQTHVAQSDHYTGNTRSVPAGETVRIGYYFNGNRYMAVIHDERLTPTSENIAGVYKVPAVISVVLLALALFQLLQALQA